MQCIINPQSSSVLRNRELFHLTSRAEDGQIKMVKEEKGGNLQALSTDH
jgi:hypothetical protein